MEWFFSFLKQYRRVATRYEKTKHNFLAFIHVASVMISFDDPGFSDCQNVVHST